MKLRKNTKRRVVGQFEAMEDRKLFAADVLGATEFIDNALIQEVGEVARTEATTLGVGGEGQPAPDDDGPWGPIGPIIREDLIVSLLGDAGMPAPDDDEPWGPIGPVVREEMVVAVAGQVGMPAPDDDDPPGPIGPVFQEGVTIVAEFDSSAAEEVGQLQTIMSSDSGDAEGKSDPGVDCDGNRLTASCELTASEPDPDPWSNPGDTDGDGDADFSDFLNLSRHFGERDATRAQGDLDGDRAVRFGDFLILSNHFGTHITPPAADIVFAG